MKKLDKPTLIIIVLLMIAISIILVSVSAIQVTKDTKFQTTRTNATFTMSDNFTWDRIEVHSTYLLLGNKTISASPSSGSVNVTLYNFTTSYIRFNANASTNVTFVIENLTANIYYTVYRDNSPIQKIQTNSSGYLSFSSNVWSERSFIIQPSKSDGLACSSDLECIGGYCVHSVCRSASTYCGDGHCDSGESCSSCSADCGICPSGGGGGTITTTVATTTTIPVTTTTVPPPITETPTVQEIQPEGEGTFTIEDEDELKVQEIIVEVKNAVSNVQLTVTRTYDQPSTVAIGAPDNVYVYLEIEKTNIEDEDITRVTIRFKVEKSWISDNNIDMDTIALNRYSDGAWNELSTTKLSEDSDYVYFEAESPELSVFAVTAEELPVTTTAPPTPTEERLGLIQQIKRYWYLILLGFAMIGIIVGIIVWRLRSRKKRYEEVEDEFERIKEKWRKIKFTKNIYLME